MDILGVAGNFLGGFGKQVLWWTVGGAVSVFAVTQITRFLAEIREHIVRKVKVEIASLEDENLQAAARHVVRYVAGKFPDISGDQKLQQAIKTLQEITPDIIVSDDKLKVLLESAYLEIKRDLKNV